MVKTKQCINSKESIGRYIYIFSWSIVAFKNDLIQATNKKADTSYYIKIKNFS